MTPKINRTENGQRLIMVGSYTPAIDLANSITLTHLKEGEKEVTLRAVGAGAASQMLKAWFIAKSKLASKGILIEADGGFKDIDRRYAPGEAVPDVPEKVSALELYLKFIVR
jgi:stage V sporulation protein SpoVS